MLNKNSFSSQSKIPGFYYFSWNIRQPKWILLNIISAKRVKFLDEAVLISLHANALWKDMNISLLLLAIVGQIGFFSLHKSTSLGEGKIIPAVLHKKITLCLILPVVERLSDSFSVPQHFIINNT